MSSDVVLRVYFWGKIYCEETGNTFTIPEIKSTPKPKTQNFQNLLPQMEWSKSRSHYWDDVTSRTALFGVFYWLVESLVHISVKMMPSRTLWPMKNRHNMPHSVRLNQFIEVKIDLWIGLQILITFGLFSGKYVKSLFYAIVSAKWNTRSGFVKSDGK